MRIAVFGTGKYYNEYRKWVEQYDIVVLIDNDPVLQGRYLNGHKIISPKELNDYTYDRIYILSTFLNEIYAQLISLGVSREKIFCFFQLDVKENSTDIIFYYPEQNIKKNRIKKSL